MAFELQGKLKIAVTTRALFQLEYENSIFEERGTEAYEQYQIEHEREILKPGVAFPLIKALLKINEIPELAGKVEVLIVSRNSANASLRVFNSIRAYGLNITRGAFTCGEPNVMYLKALDVDLFLTANHKAAQEAVDFGIPAAELVLSDCNYYEADKDYNEIRIAFDGDAVLFAEDSEVIYKTYGLPAFVENEARNAELPMAEGPLVKFLRAVAFLQEELRNTGNESVKIYTALVTSRNAPAHERAIKTLRSWGIRIDEAFFLGGIRKSLILEAFDAQIFFDDQLVHSKPAAEVIPSGTVPSPSRSVLHKGPSAEQAAELTHCGN